MLKRLCHHVDLPMNNSHQSTNAVEPYAEGIRLFNTGHFWEAHEQWEECWRGTGEPEATFYKGIIQTAAALVHWQRGNNRGLQRNWFKARAKLETLSSPMHGLNLSLLVATMDEFVGAGGHTKPPQLIFAPQNATNP